MITINPARQLGIADRVGSIEIGKDADITLWSGYPLSIYSVCEKTWIDGKLYFDKDNDKADQRIKIDPKENYEDSFHTHHLGEIHPFIT